MRETTGKRAAAKIMAPLAVVLGLAGCAATGNPPISLEERFYQVAFYNEEYERETRLSRWERPFDVNVSGGSPEDRGKIASILKQLSEATGLPGRIRDDEPSDIRLSFVGALEWEVAVESRRIDRKELGLSYEDYDPVCIVLYINYPKTAVEITIPDDLDWRIRSLCIAQELSHASGLVFDTNMRSDTVFGDGAGAPRLTPIDYTLLRILHDQRLRVGMTWAEARPIVQQIISELEAS